VNFQRGKEKEPLEINLVPLIDVMLVILIFLMVTTSYSKYTELQINLPTANTEKQLERSNEIAVVVSAQGEYVVNRVRAGFDSTEQFAEVLKQAAAGKKDPLVVISADAKASHESVVRVMWAAQSAGLGQISFTTQAAPK